MAERIDLRQAAQWFRTAASAFDAVESAKTELSRLERLQGEVQTATQTLLSDREALTRQREQFKAELAALGQRRVDVLAERDALREEVATLTARKRQLEDELAALRSRVGMPA